MSAFTLTYIFVLSYVMFKTANTVNTDTCTVSEFHDFNDLKAFLMNYQLQLDNSIGPIYDTFNEMSFNKQNVLQLSSIDLRKILNHNGLEKHHIRRLINVLHHVKDSQVHKDMKRKELMQNLHDALENIVNTNAFYDILQQHLIKLAAITKELQQNSANTAKLINDKFDMLVNSINQRRNDLLANLVPITDKKIKQVSKRADELSAYQASLEELDNLYDESLNLIKDEAVPAKRPKLVNKIKKILDSGVLLMDFEPLDENIAYIEARINTKNIVADVQRLGVVEGRKSEIVTMKTDVQRPQQTSFIFGTITNGYKHWIVQQGKTLKVLQNVDGFVTSCNPKGYSAGIHTFQIHVNGKVTGQNALSVVSGTMPTARMHWISEHIYKHYFFNSKNGVIYTGNDKQVAKLKKWRRNDVIVMTMDCNEWTLTFDMENNRLSRARAQTIKITKNKYYTCLTVEPKKGVKFSIVDSTW